MRSKNSILFSNYYDDYDDDIILHNKINTCIFFSYLKNKQLWNYFIKLELQSSYIILKIRELKKNEASLILY